MPIVLRTEIFVGLLVFALYLCVGMSEAQSNTCTLDDLAAAVDEVGSSIREFNRDAMPAVSRKLKELSAAKGWSQDDWESQAARSLHDKRMAGFDSKTVSLFEKIDGLGPKEGETSAECSRVAELRASGLELLAVMKAKAAYTISKIDTELAAGSSTEGRAEVADTVAPVDTPKPKGPEALASNQAPDPTGQPGPWQTQTKQLRKTVTPETGYTIAEIRQATKGFFGTISTNLASVLEYAFKNSGRPSAYVLGNEGGGAFLAGVRYGKGTLYLREGGRREIYWHGPSLGSDIGASGSRTMFLIYDLAKPDEIYRTFTGIDGSAYFVGGVGITLLKGGDVVMAPIRSGVGFRLGANVGYIRFTPGATWNPF